MAAASRNKEAYLQGCDVLGEELVPALTPKQKPKEHIVVGIEVAPNFSIARQFWVSVIAGIFTAGVLTGGAKIYRGLR